MGDVDLYADMDLAQRNVGAAPAVQTQQSNDNGNSTQAFNAGGQQRGNQNFNQGYQNQNNGFQRRSRNPDEKKYPLYIGGLTWWTNDEDVYNALRVLGVTDIHDFRFYENRHNGQSKGFCLVVLDNEASAKTILDKLPQTQIHSQTPVVTWASKRKLDEFNEIASRNQPRGRRDKEGNTISNSNNNQQNNDQGGNQMNMPRMPFPGNQMMPRPGMPPGMAGMGMQQPQPQTGMRPNMPPNLMNQQPNFQQQQQHQQQQQQQQQMMANMMMARAPPPISQMQPQAQQAFMQQMAQAQNGNGMPQQQQQQQPPQPLVNQMPAGLTQQMQPAVNPAVSSSMGHQDTGGHGHTSGHPSVNDAEFEEILDRNKKVQTAALSKAALDGASGNYNVAIDTLMTAISLIKNSKISSDERCQLLVSTLEETLRGIQTSSAYAAVQNAGSGRRGSSRDRRRDRRSRSRSYERDSYRSSRDRRRDDDDYRSSKRR